MNQRIRPLVETAAIEERKFWPDPRMVMELIKNPPPTRVGPMTFPVSYPELPGGSRVAVIQFFFIAGDSAQIWPEDDESEKVELGPEDGELDMPVGPSRRWMIHLPPNVRMSAVLVDAR